MQVKPLKISNSDVYKQDRWVNVATRVEVFFLLLTLAFRKK